MKTFIIVGINNYDEQDMYYWWLIQVAVTLESKWPINIADTVDIVNIIKSIFKFKATE